MGVNRVLLREHVDGFVMRQVVHQLCLGYPRCYHNRDWVEVRGLMENVHRQHMFMQTQRKESETRTLLRLIDLHCRHVPIMLCIDDLHHCSDKDWHLVLAIAQYIHQANHSTRKRPAMGAASVVYGSTGLRGSGSLARSVGSALSSAAGRSRDSRLGFDSAEHVSPAGPYVSAAKGVMDSVASTAKHDADESRPSMQDAVEDAADSIAQGGSNWRDGQLSPLAPKTPKELGGSAGRSFEHGDIPGAVPEDATSSPSQAQSGHRSPRAALHARVGLHARPERKKKREKKRQN